jgi:hypothetical protein
LGVFPFVFGLKSSGAFSFCLGIMLNSIE